VMALVVSSLVLPARTRSQASAVGADRSVNEARWICDCISPRLSARRSVIMRGDRALELGEIACRICDPDSGQPSRERPSGARLGSDSARKRGGVHATVHHQPTMNGRHNAPPFQRASDAFDRLSRGPSRDKACVSAGDAVRLTKRQSTNETAPTRRCSPDPSSVSASVSTSASVRLERRSAGHSDCQPAAGAE
jgi:hypothetical protein